MLDVGCGEGRHIFGFMDVHANVNCVGIDLDLPSIIESKKNLTLFSSISNKESNFLQGSLYHLPFNDQTFETIICSEVLEHVSDVESALNEIDRLLKPGGKLLISVPSFLPEKICWLLSKDYQEMPGGHVRIFKKNILKNLITKRGYIYLNSEKFHALHSPYWWLRCLFWDTQDTNFFSQTI